jgi:uncharacterized surface protein with fasciclin (FAS1) repeats
MIGTKNLLAGLLGLALVVPGAACTQNTPVQAVQGDIVAVASAAGSFSTLLAAVEAAGLVGVLKGEGPFTVFAPTDAAFAALPEGTVEALLADPDALRAVLTYHVVPGRVTASQLVSAGGATPATANGQTLNIVVNGGVVRVDDATVVTADVMASNGVIHVIDSVLLPSMK